MSDPSPYSYQTTISNPVVGIASWFENNLIYHTQKIITPSKFHSVSFNNGFFKIWLNSEVTSTESDALINLKYDPIYRPKHVGFDAVVSNDDRNPGDYTTISEAFAAGRVNVYVRNGTYDETGDIQVPNRGQIIGESPGGVFITSGTIKIRGGNTAETSGTISIVSGTDTVTGVGTTFTNLEPGQFILIGTNFYDIVNIQNDTSLTISDVYLGKSLTSQVMNARSLFSGNRLSNLIINGAVGNGIEVSGLRKGSFSNISVHDCGGNGMSFVDCAELSIELMSVDSCVGYGVSLERCITVLISTVNNYNNSCNGYNIIRCEDVNSFSCTSESNGGRGYDILDSSNNIALTDCILKNNFGDGIRIGNSKNITAKGVTCSTNGANGMSIDSSENVLIEISAINQNVSNGIVATNGSVSVTVTGNVLSGNAIVFDGVTKSKIGFNNVSSSGIQVQGVSSELHITNNNTSGFLTVGGNVTDSVIGMNIINGIADIPFGGDFFSGTGVGTPIVPLLTSTQIFPSPGNTFETSYPGRYRFTITLTYTVQKKNSKAVLSLAIGSGVYEKEYIIEGVNETKTRKPNHLVGVFVDEIPSIGAGTHTISLIGNGGGKVTIISSRFEIFKID